MLVVNRNGGDVVSNVVVGETDVLAAAHVSEEVAVANSVNVPLRNRQFRDVAIADIEEAWGYLLVITIVAGPSDD